MIKIAINGFGRIGRIVFRRILDKHQNLKVAAINDLTDNKTLAHLLKYDSVHGIYNKNISWTENSINVDNEEFLCLSESEPAELPWKKLGIDIVLECTGRFTDYENAKKHIKAGAKKVIISAPSKSPEVPHFVLGVNEEKYNNEDVICMSSCTTNCLAPIAKVLNDNLGIEKGLMTTIHSYTTSQRILDLPHKDLRRARAAALSIIPTTTGAAISVIKAIPELEGKLNGIAIRVPTPCGSIVDFVALVKKETTKEEVIEIFEKESESDRLKGILKVEERPLVSVDYIGNSYSSIVDKEFVMIEDKNLVKILSWYDNEWGYSCRLAEFAEYIGRKL
ncbi:type I glyceraldehyde-3-phosphate dehydrogenase [bacterium]|nr:type I glyceraldehyde-3-phosphate dehydrogenase [bacterium]